ncbi:LOW QUALITY PROTEIN: IgGFc-binding protein-like [Lepidochelys kempii]|uniref:LOW QUALITY PROTEIN: IgGFc-binding protein-like n=1 Tax=Lepidochelys kempii TaxID=8472 RepID=UPI003C6EA81F
MATRRMLLLWARLALLAGPGTATPMGREFITAFLQNYQIGYSQADFQLFISGYSPSTTVTVEMRKSQFRHTFQLGQGQTVSVKIPANAEMSGTTKFCGTVLVQADKDVSVMSLNAKKLTADTGMVYPVQSLGVEYYVLTPAGDVSGTYKEFSIMAWREPTTVEIHLKGSVRFQERVYSAGSKITVSLEPYEAVQFQSNQDLSGTRVVSLKPVAVQSGHSCAQKNTKCNHVAEQLLPVCGWGTAFFVPPMPFQAGYDLVYIVASQVTRLTYLSGGARRSQGLVSGQVLQLEVSLAKPLYISASAGIQVFFFCTGGTQGTMRYDPFLVSIPDVSSYCTSYSITGQQGFKNYAIVVAKIASAADITMDRRLPSRVLWKPIPGTEYSWGVFNLGIRASAHSVENPRAAFGLLSVGIAQQNGYGMATLCQSASPVPSCSSMQCQKKETCQMANGRPVCMATSVATCWALGDPHYRTFDGCNYDFMGTCTYTLAKTFSSDSALPAFHVTAKNENRGNQRVAYVGFVTVQVYGYTVSVVRNEYGLVRVNAQHSRLPISLMEGKLKLYQSGGSVVIETDFSLKVSYDWGSSLVVKISSSFWESVQGLCGNYNGDARDDFATPTGVLAASPVEFGKSWKVEDGDRFCWDDCHGECKNCSPELVGRYKAKPFCGWITKEVEGPFSLCHSMIDPKIYLDNCVYDLCMNDGLKEMLCRALTSYADACRREGVAISEWRSLAGCTLPCPENSQYQLCSSTCPATCNDRAAPNNCSLPCVETCQCNEGFVLDAGKCISKAGCGCEFEGRLYAPGEQFWGNDACTRRCVCNPQTRQVSCQVAGCRAGEQCQVEKGIQNCYPTNYASCMTSGGSHYHSFDGQRFDFQGTCQYQLSGLSKKSQELVDFRVLVRNARRGGQSVSFRKVVQVHVYGVETTVSWAYRGKIMVNGILTNLPYQVGTGKISMYQRGWDAVIQTDFGLTVTFDWHSRVTVTMPSTYASTLGGLCGNFNGDRSDEPAGKAGVGAGRSWRVAEPLGCGEVDVGACPDLEALAHRQRGVNTECGIILENTGPFRECHSRIDPEGFFLDCVSDYCVSKGQMAVLGQVVAGYASACQAAGVIVHPWRYHVFWKPACPLNSHYEVCARGCQPTCSSLYAPVQCSAQCWEGCVCDEGFVLSGDRCVPMSQCGCVHQGFYYQAGETFHPTCQEQCICQAGGDVACKGLSCGPKEECKVAGSVRRCHPVGSATCTVSGSSHYITFDGAAANFQGTCTYALATTCTDTQKLMPFTVHLENKLRGTKQVSVAKLVSIRLYGTTLSLLQGMRGLIRVDGVSHNLPVVVADGRLWAYQHGGNVLVQTDFGLTVSYDLLYNVRVTIPGNYQGRRVPAPRCCLVCEETKKDVFKQRHYCGLLTASDGPFAACHGTVSPSVYFNNCLYDVCLGNRDSQVLCQSIHSYVTACQEAGAPIQPWRSPSFCPLSCPANSHYEVCADLCTATCAWITDSTPCPETCAEGCQCDDGFFFDGQGCVTVESCGCFERGRYLKPNETVLVNECQQRCSCSPARGVSCESHSCASNETCETKNGVTGCINKDPCKSLRCWTKETCKVENGRAMCVPDYKKTCWGWGDPHYHTFDGLDFDFQGTCTYTLAKYCGTDPTLEPFTIDEKNDNRGGNQVVSYVRLTNIYVYGYNISIHKKEVGKVRLNDVITSLPLTLADGKLRLLQSGLSAMLQTAFGLEVSFDWNWLVEVTLPSSYYGATCGLCGNYNQDPADDMVTPADAQPSSVVEWAASWKVRDRDPFCWHICQGKCPTCEEEQRQRYYRDEACGLIAKMDGPFRECHRKLSPENFFDSCVYDVCLNGGAKTMLCQALGAYAASCRTEGVVVRDWRTQSGCTLPCPANSHYKACGNACPASCSDQTSPSSCREPCVETCQCDNGYVLSAGQCVPMGSCGCDYNGRYYKPSEEFWADENCCFQCRCDPSLGMVVCQETSCKASERCAVVNGIRGCHAISYSTCMASGDHHYTAFTGRRYDFQGTCIYKLSGLCSKDPTLTPFNVTIQNNRSSRALSFAEVVTVEVYGRTIAVSQQHPLRIQVDGVFVDLPYYHEETLQAYISGAQVLIKTAFNLRVTFDGSSLVQVTMPNTYANALCGLCGNGNQSPGQDLIMRDGSRATNAVQFAESWKVGEVPGCSDSCTGDCPVCSEAQRQPYKGDQYCGVLTTGDGPFRQCHGAIDPAPFFNDCLSDTCQYKGHHSALCGAIGAYVTACQAGGIQIGPWRTASFCSPTCPHNSHYELCGSGCPATCHGLSAPDGCDAPCAEGCFCDAGFLLSGDRCVPVAQCGCVHQGTYYRKGEEFHASASCRERCRCQDNGVVECQEASCGASEQCRVENGVLGCHATGCGKCTVAGNSHYLTLDGWAFDFQGSCAYTLAELCSSSAWLANFSVVVEKESSGDGRVAWTRMLVVSVHGYAITVERGRKWSVNGELYALPLALDSGRIRVNQEGKNVVVQTDFGLKFFYDASYYALVSVPSSYKGHVCGLCGNFNGDKNDDFLLPGGKSAQNADEFGASWKVPVDGATCADGCGERCPVCDAAKTAPYQVESSCGLIRATSGPFRDCHSLVSPAEYFNHCLYDMCAANGAGETLCQSLQAYAAACQAAGAKIRAWRMASFCSLACPANSHYELCTRSCDFTCAGLSTPAQCTGKCFEGCQCDVGYAADGEGCVSVDGCGCVRDGRYIRAGESVVSGDCSETCTCHATAGLVCEPHSCPAGEACALQDGVRGCVKREGWCTLLPGAWLTSFDGTSGKVLDSGAYEVASLCNGSAPSWFRVVVEVQQCSNGGVVAGAAIYVFFQEAFVVVKRNKETWVNGHPVPLPVKISNVSVSESQGGVAVVQALGLQVLFSPSGEVLLRVGESLANKLCAPCGNFNGNVSDDLRLPSGAVTGNLAEVVAAWKSRDFSRW